MDDQTLEGRDESQDLGYIAAYGVMIVPPSERDNGGWMVTLTEWREQAETYAASMDGPIFETRQEALDEANKVLDWISDLGNRDDLMRIWEEGQRDIRRRDLEEDDPRTLGKFW